MLVLYVCANTQNVLLTFLISMRLTELYGLSGLWPSWQGRPGGGQLLAEVEVLLLASSEPGSGARPPHRA